MDQKKQRTEAIRLLARSLGFDLVGFASSSDFGDRWDFYSDWLARGFAGSMGYLVNRREMRRGVRELMPECNTVVCLAQNYHVGAAAQPGRLEGWISRYAWGDDYHDEMRARVAKVVDGLREIGGPDVQARSYVDTGPILERELAMRSGLGFIGKNTCVISQRIGSWVLLAEVLTNLELEPDEAAAPHCGRCTRCLDACPTKAFAGPYLLDATRCISYLTIELRGAIPRDLRPLMGTHVFGCDICQAVCPWNRFARPTENEAFQPRSGLQAPRLLELMDLDRETWQSTFRGSAVKRAKFAGFRRNVAVALGNTGAVEAVPTLTRALEDAEALVRQHVAWALGRIGGLEARTALMTRLTREGDAEVRNEIELALAGTAGQADRG